MCYALKKGGGDASVAFLSPYFASFRSVMTPTQFLLRPDCEIRESLIHGGVSHSSYWT